MTGVQTCALPIYSDDKPDHDNKKHHYSYYVRDEDVDMFKFGYMWLKPIDLKPNDDYENNFIEDIDSIDKVFSNI